jgi:uncharacterized protein (TIGR03083 family)
MTTPQPGFDDILAALHDSHDRLAAAAGPLTPDQVTAPSYDDEWSIAQVLSHLGSGAEIFTMMLDAGLAGDQAPGMEAFQEVWDRWNAKEPRDQVRDSIASDARFLDRLDALTQAERASWRMSLFGGDKELSDVARMRLGEHALHTWDVAVMFDPALTVPDGETALLVDGLDALVARVGKPVDRAIRVHVSTQNPDRAFALAAGPEGITLSPTESDPADHDASLRLPAEAFTRLVYGRLDPDHTPTVDSQGIDLDTLRAAFPGF